MLVWRLGNAPVSLVDAHKLMSILRYAARVSAVVRVEDANTSIARQAPKGELRSVCPDRLAHVRTHGFDVSGSCDAYTMLVAEGKRYDTQYVVNVMRFT